MSAKAPTPPPPLPGDARLSGWLPCPYCHHRHRPACQGLSAPALLALGTAIGWATMLLLVALAMAAKP